MVIVCPKCGFENIAERTICKRCGASLASTVPTQPSAGIRPKTLWRGCLSISLVVLLLLAYIPVRWAMLPSALDHLHQLAQLPPLSAADLPAVRSALLQVVPLGTDDSAVTAFLQQAGADVGEDAVMKQRRMIVCGTNTWDDLKPDIYCFIHGERPSLRILCRDEYEVSFHLDPKTKKVIDITVADTSHMQCL
jgi:hypothetical protein